MAETVCVYVQALSLPLKVLSEATVSPDKSKRQIVSQSDRLQSQSHATSNCCTPTAIPISVLFISDPLISLLVCSAWQAAKRKTFFFLSPSAPLCSALLSSVGVIERRRRCCAAHQGDDGESSTPSGLLTQLCAGGNFTVTNPPSGRRRYKMMV